MKQSEAVAEPDADADEGAAGTAGAFRRLAVAVSIAALGPTLLTMGMASALSPLSPLFESALALVAIVSTRGQNAAARWMLMGPGAPKGRLLLGSFLLGVDWLAVGIFLKRVAGDDADAAFLAMLGALKLLCAVCAVAWWGIASLGGERDRIPGLAVPGRTFGIRDLFVGLLLFGLLLAGARLAYDLAATKAEPSTLGVLLIGGVAVAIWSGVTFAIDMAMRLFMLGDERRRGVGVALFFLLFVLAIALPAGAVHFAASMVGALVFFGTPYLVLLAIFEGVLRHFGARAVNVRGEPAIPADPSG